MTGFWKHIGKGSMIFPAILLVSGLIHAAGGADVYVFAFGNFALYIFYLQGLIFPDLDMVSSIPHQYRDIFFLPQAVVLGFLSAEAVGVQVSFGETLTWMVPILLWVIVIILIFQYSFQNFISGHRGETHYISVFVLVSIMNFLLGGVFGFVHLQFNLADSLILGLDAGVGFFLGALIHKWLD